MFLSLASSLKTLDVLLCDTDEHYGILEPCLETRRQMVTAVLRTLARFIFRNTLLHKMRNVFANVVKCIRSTKRSDETALLRKCENGTSTDDRNSIVRLILCGPNCFSQMNEIQGSCSQLHVIR